MNLGEIYDGWKHLIFKDDQVEEVATKRLKVCGDCPIRSRGFCDSRKGGCGCLLEAKVRSLNSVCPKGLW